MTQEQKIIRAKVGLLELARQLGNVGQACEMLGYSRGCHRYRAACLGQVQVSCSHRWKTEPVHRLKSEPPA